MADNIKDFAVNSARWLSLEDFEGEVWKDILYYDGWYKASNMGRIKSVGRYTKNKNNKMYIKERILRFSKWTNYYRVKLSINGYKRDYSVHRIIAGTFIENPNNLPEVDHINADKLDNRAINLKWVTHFANMNNPNTRNITSKPVELLSDEGTLLATFPTIIAASKVIGINRKSLHNILTGKKFKFQSKWKNLNVRYKTT